MEAIRRHRADFEDAHLSVDFVVAFKRIGARVARWVLRRQLGERSVAEVRALVKGERELLVFIAHDLRRFTY